MVYLMCSMAFYTVTFHILNCHARKIYTLAVNLGKTWLHCLSLKIYNFFSHIHYPLPIQAFLFIYIFNWLIFLVHNQEKWGTHFFRSSRFYVTKVPRGDSSSCLTRAKHSWQPLTRTPPPSTPPLWCTSQILSRTRQSYGASSLKEGGRRGGGGVAQQVPKDQRASCLSYSLWARTSPYVHAVLSRLFHDSSDLAVLCHFLNFRDITKNVHMHHSRLFTRHFGKALLDWSQLNK